MKLPRRTFMQFAGAAATMQAFSLVAVPQSFPTRPIAMIVPIAAGSSLDVFGRIIAERMAKSLGQPIIIENVSGADGTIGVSRAARAKPDGLVISLATGRVLRSLDPALWKPVDNTLFDW